MVLLFDPTITVRQFCTEFAIYFSIYSHFLFILVVIFLKSKSALFRYKYCASSNQLSQNVGSAGIKRMELF